MKVSMTEADLPIDIPPIIQSGDFLEELLRITVLTGADDLLLRTECKAQLKLNKKIYYLTRRELNTQDILNFGTFLNNGSSISAVVGQGNQLNDVISLPLDKEGKVIPKEQRSAFSDPDSTFRFRINIVGCQAPYRTGCAITLRRIESEPPEIEKLGMTSSFVERFLQRKIGINFVAGATGQGKSTTLASIIAYLLQKEDAHENIVTAEAPVEYVYFKVNKPSSDIKQLQIGRDVESFDLAVKNMLRMALTTGLIGEMQDESIIRAGIRLAQTGHRVFTTVHADDVASIFPRCVSYSGDSQRQLLSELTTSTNSLLAQRLVPATNGKKVAVREELHLDSRLRHIISTTNPNDLKNVVRDLLEKNGTTFNKDAERLHQEGKISDETLKTFKTSY